MTKLRSAASNLEIETNLSGYTLLWRVSHQSLAEREIGSKANTPCYSQECIYLCLWNAATFLLETSVFKGYSLGSFHSEIDLAMMLPWLQIQKKKKNEGLNQTRRVAKRIRNLRSLATIRWPQFLHSWLYFCLLFKSLTRRIYIRMSSHSINTWSQA